MDNDLISRQAAIELWEQYNPYIAVKACEYGKRLRSLPSAERHGQWKDIPFTARWICSNCDYISEFASFKYCPDCGAKMDDDWEEPAINPCQGCEDYDGRGGCISKGGCGARMEAIE